MIWVMGFYSLFPEWGAETRAKSYPVKWACFQEDLLKASLLLMVRGEVV